jgi:unsaturated rhamnogalacturonyl hydrolase
MDKIDKSQVKQLADQVFTYMTAEHGYDWGMNIDSWDWVPGVGVMAISSYYEASHNDKALCFLLDWIERNKAKSKAKMTVNSLAPFAVFPDMYRRTGDLYYRNEAENCARWLLTEAPRTREHAFEHTVTENAVFPEQVWADTIFMAVLFLAKSAKQANNQEMAVEAMNQVTLHLRLLQDAESGVLFHGWNSEDRNHMSSARWTRANAWVMLAVPDIIQLLQDMIEVPQEIIERFQLLADGLLRFQTKSGLWHTVMGPTVLLFGNIGKRRNCLWPVEICSPWVVG